jgi:hypothetical protein
MLRLIVPLGWSARTVNSALKGSAPCAKALAGRDTPQQSATCIATTVEVVFRSNRELFILFAFGG